MTGSPTPSTTGASTRPSTCTPTRTPTGGRLELGREIPPGLFGENLRTSGIDLSGIRIGQVLRIGDDVVLEVTAPRTPCATFARRMGEPHWVRRFTERRAPGAYARVLQAGVVLRG